LFETGGVQGDENGWASVLAVVVESFPAPPIRCAASVRGVLEGALRCWEALAEG